MQTWEIYQGDATTWNEKVSKLDNFTLYQLFEWGEAKKSTNWEVLRLSSSSFDCMVQGFLKRLPFSCALLWIPGGINGNLQSLNTKLLAKLIGVRFLFVRASFNTESKILEHTLSQTKWSKSKITLNTGLSMMIDPTRDEDELRKQMGKNWRHNLNRSLKKEIRVERWSEIDSTDLVKIYKEFESMKSLGEQFNTTFLKDLIRTCQNRIIILRAFDGENNFLGLRGMMHHQTKAIDLFAITTDQGRKLYASYKLMWEIFKVCKELNISSYDFSGIDPINNKGVYNFKKGSGAHPITYAGEWDTSNIALFSRLFNFLLYMRTLLMNSGKSQIAKRSQ